MADLRQRHTACALFASVMATTGTLFSSLLKDKVCFGDVVMVLHTFNGELFTSITPGHNYIGTRFRVLDHDLVAEVVRIDTRKLEMTLAILEISDTVAIINITESEYVVAGAAGEGVGAAQAGNGVIGGGAGAGVGCCFIAG